MSGWTGMPGQTSAVGRGRRPLPVWAKYAGLAADRRGAAGRVRLGVDAQHIEAAVPPGRARLLQGAAVPCDRDGDARRGPAPAPKAAPVQLPHAAAKAAAPAGLRLKPMDVWAATRGAAPAGDVQSGAGAAERGTGRA